MKQIFLLTLLVLTTATATARSRVVVTVKNPIEAARTDAAVEVAWSKIARIAGATPYNIVVFDADEKEIPSQVLYNDDAQPEMLLFLINIAPRQRLRYTIRVGERHDYPARAYGRQVPERFDDYAWENDLVAHRIYGEALADPRTQGLDVWSKSTSRLVLDEWYASEDYHTNHGEGMDNYKVGNTLGGGASAPVIDDKIVLAGNYKSFRVLANGPLRTSVRLTYEFGIHLPNTIYSGVTPNWYPITLTKTITLDAGSRFNRVEDTYDTYDGVVSEVILGMAEHNLEMEITTPPHTVALGEWTSDHNKNIDPVTLGRIYTAIISPTAAKDTEFDGHLGLRTTASRNQPIVYYVGSAWSLGGIEDFAAWQTAVAHELLCLEHPLQITVK